MATWLLTGADKGIGFAMAVQLLQRGDRVVAACLHQGAELAEKGALVVPGIDVTSAEAVARLARALDENGVQPDVVVHVAGVLGRDELGKIDYADIQRQIDINAIGPLRAIEAVAPALREGSKVGIITSRVGSLDDNTSGGMYAYRMSKAAANMVGLNLHHDLKRRGVAVLMLHPGMVATDLTKGFPGDFKYIRPEEAAAGLIRNMDELTMETAGLFRHANGEYLPW